MNQHYVDAEYFLVSYWPGTQPDDNIQTIKTDSNFFWLYPKRGIPSAENGTFYVRVLYEFLEFAR